MVSIHSLVNIEIKKIMIYSYHYGIAFKTYLGVSHYFVVQMHLDLCEKRANQVDEIAHHMRDRRNKES